jgi:hypothetical protein
MSKTDYQKNKKTWVLRNFLAGLGIGALFGMCFPGLVPSTEPRLQISVGFWGLVGGMLGASCGLIRRLINKRK